MSSEIHAVPPFSLRTAVRARHIAVPAEHGAWVFLFSPLIMGLSIGGLELSSLLLVLAVLFAFLLRQPLNILVKVYSGRRPKTELPNAFFWLAAYAVLALACTTALVVLGHGAILWLIIPAAPVFAWHLWLVSRRAERRQALVEIVASGVLALSAPAAFWVGRGQVDPAGWWLWGLSWLQAAGTILYAYLRLEQRQLLAAPTWMQGVRMARVALLYNFATLAIVIVLSAISLIPAWIPLAFLIQPIEVIWGVLHPAIGVKPKSIGIRQLIISSLFTIVFILTWLL
jgi:hypothetical protein